jgi:Ca2+/Na+ antiporter
MGLTVLAAGESIQDCLASLYVARDGKHMSSLILFIQNKIRQENIDVAIKCRPGKTIKKSYEKLLIG